MNFAICTSVTKGKLQGLVVWYNDRGQYYDVSVKADRYVYSHARQWAWLLDARMD
jgi:hypothetical protein